MADINERVDNEDLSTELKTPDLKMEKYMMLLQPNPALLTTCYKGWIPIYSFFVTTDVTSLTGANISKGFGVGGI